MIDYFEALEATNNPLLIALKRGVELLAHAEHLQVKDLIKTLSI